MAEPMMGKIGVVVLGIGLVAGFIIGLGVGASECMRDKKHDPVLLQAEFDAYRHCMQVAGQMRCRMTPQDFVRYYDIKRQLQTIAAVEGDDG